MSELLIPFRTAKRTTTTAVQDANFVPEQFASIDDPPNDANNNVDLNGNDVKHVSMIRVNSGSSSSERSNNVVSSNSNSDAEIKWKVTQVIAPVKTQPETNPDRSRSIRKERESETEADFGETRGHNFSVKGTDLLAISGQK